MMNNDTPRVVPQISTRAKNRHSYINTPLTKYKHVIDEYWDEFERVLKEYEADVMSVSGIDPRSVQLIRNLKKIERWKSNLFILYLHYHKLSKLADALNVNQSSLSVYISNIKKEIKC